MPGPGYAHVEQAALLFFCGGGRGDAPVAVQDEDVVEFQALGAVDRAQEKPPKVWTSRMHWTRPRALASIKVPSTALQQFFIRQAYDLYAFADEKYF